MYIRVGMLRQIVCFSRLLRNALALRDEFVNYPPAFHSNFRYLSRHRF